MPVHPNPLRAAFAEQRAVVGTFAWSNAPGVVEVLGHAGFDCVVLDAEHSPMGPADLAHLVRAAETAGIVPIVGVASLDSAEIGRALDAGAGGVIVPQVSGPVGAQHAVMAAKYHPLGRRGMATARSAGYGVHGTAGYYEDANRETLLILQIETREGVEHLPSILSVQGYDAVLIGPYDLSQSLGYPGQIDLPAVHGVIEGVIRQSAAAGLPVGMYVRDMAAARHWRDAGCQLLIVATDLDYIADGARAALKQWRPG